MCAGLTMELVSVIDEQTTVLAEATVRLRCLAMLATPMRDRAAKESTAHIKSQIKPE